MPYHLSIVRNKNAKHNPISLEELRQFAMRRSDVRNPEKGENGWFPKCHLEQGDWFGLFWSDEYLFAKNLEPEAIDLLVGIANDLGARLVGEEG